MQKNQSLLIQSVSEVDYYFSELARLGSKIVSMDTQTDSDCELMQKWLNQFTECGQGLSQEIMNFSKNLNDMREQAESTAKSVEAKALELQERKNEVQKRMDDFRSLSQKVSALAVSLNQVKPVGDTVSDEERSVITATLIDFESKLQPLIDEANQLKNAALEAKMKPLEQNADSLRQSLLAISKKLHLFREEGVGL